MWLHHVSGEAAGQDVFHFHLHLIPRYHDDTVRPAWGTTPWRPPGVSEADLDEIATRVTNRL
jgi:histidine triad (HIT) family protein